MVAKQFIQFYKGDQPAIGGDACQPIDARLSPARALLEGARRARALRGVGKHYNGVQVLRGEAASSARAVTNVIPIHVRSPQ